MIFFILLIWFIEYIIDPGVYFCLQPRDEGIFPSFSSGTINISHNFVLSILSFVSRTEVYFMFKKDQVQSPSVFEPTNSILGQVHTF